jgi:hypothetical protein
MGFRSRGFLIEVEGECAAFVISPGIWRCDSGS